ncbi:unnamed protein product [Clavelina lepadiformis]|uniref:Uncharacterized protein n=1 Tax=Clavelina lepadiformis TaxID=159417 RepID=A0ABP0G0T6_CLALP
MKGLLESNNFYLQRQHLRTTVIGAINSINVTQTFSQFESFCHSVKASNAAKKHAFLQSLSEDMRFSITGGRKELYEFSYDELIQQAKDMASGLSS